MLQKRLHNGMDRQAHHIAARPGYRVHEKAAEPLDSVRPSLVHGFAGSNVGLEDGLGKYTKGDERGG